MQLLFEQIPFTTDYKGQRDRITIELLYTTGMRRAELAGLTLKSLNLFNNTLKIEGKGTKQRIIPLLPQTAKNLQQYLDSRQQTFGTDSPNALLLSNKGQPIYAEWIYRTVKKYLGLITTQTYRGPHLLRHTFATHLLNNGAELNDIKTLLGHANLNATQIYTHNTIEKMKQHYQRAHPKAQEQKKDNDQ